MEAILQLDRSIVLGLNACHTPFWDTVMSLLSSNAIWIPLYLAVATLMFLPKWYGAGSYVRKTGSPLPFWLIGLAGVVAAILCFALTDSLTNVVKNLVERPRPGHEPLLAGMLHLPTGAGGLYGFFSGHAANTFGFAVITSLIFRRRSYTAALILWATSIAFSRIWLAMHYPTDIICGAIFGTLIALAIYTLYRFTLNKLASKIPAR